jgi:hypothetical protein
MKVIAQIKFFGIPLIPAFFVAGFASNKIISSWDVLFIAYFACLTSYALGFIIGKSSIKEKWKDFFDQVE